MECWNVESTITDGERGLEFNYTNNSDYIITYFEIDFVQTDEVTDEQVESFYTSIQKKYDFDDEVIDGLKEDYPDGIEMHAYIDLIADVGEKLAGSIYYFQGYYYMNDSDQYELVEPDIATIKYISNGSIYTEYYDFQDDSYVLDSSVVIADELATLSYDLVNYIPELSTSVIEIISDSDDKITLYAYGIDTEEYKTYITSCDEAGYNINKESKMDSDWYYYFNAENEDGYSIDLDYDIDEQELRLMITSPDYIEE
ncbi:MAG: hypothetical protein LUG12_01780 [Erysipelotrichaceae bacterium]|nr:hypothetical protein [Erysipelotrichaceae bacterium]